MSEPQSLPPSTRAIYAAFDFLEGRYRKILAILVAIAILGVLLTGFYVVKKEQRGVRTRFGRVVDAQVGPGLGYAVPLIERMHIRKVKRILGHEVSSTKGNQKNFTILTGDTNLIEADVVVQYKIDNLRAYLFASADPVTLLTALVREELINILGQNFIDLIFTSNRDVIQQHLLEDVVQRLEALDFGLEIVSLNIVNVRPIQETLQAFRDVNDAIAEREEVVSVANRKKEQLLARSKGQAEALVMNARANARARVVQARSSATVFRDLLAEYRKNPKQVAITRYWQRMRTIFAEASLSVVNPGTASNIDINMIDGAAGVPPTAVAAQTPPSLAAPGERLSRSTMPLNVHALESVTADKPLIEGRFHRPQAERDHTREANPRSLIFDTPSIFSHRHGVSRRGGVNQQTTLRSMVEKTLNEGESRRQHGGN